eukprot:jgi/Ulvmu1/8043/UM004_0280.1
MFHAHRGCAGLGGHPAKTTVGGCSTALRRDLRRSARPRRPDYASRRSGSDEENVRRASRGNLSRIKVSSPSTASPESPSLGWGTQHQSDSHQSGNGGSAQDFRSQQRRSASYASRRSGSDPENERRRSGSSSPSFFDSGAQPTSPSSSSDSRPHVDQRVQRRRSIDRASRRNGSNGAGRRADSPSMTPPQSARDTASPSPAHNSPHIDPRVRRRRSINYAARRSGSDGGSVRRRSTTPAKPTSSPAMDPRVERRRSMDYASRRSDSDVSRASARSSSPSTSPGDPPRTAYRDPRVQRRASLDYASRRSASNGSSARRRSPSSHSPPAPASSATPARSMPHMDPRVQKRRSIDYSGRRGGQDSDTGRRFVAPTAQQPPRQQGGHPYVQRKSADYASRRTGQDEENQRRRSGDGPGLPESTAAAPSAAPQPRRSADRRRRTPDYAARRGGEVTRRRSSIYSRSPAAGARRGVAADARTNNGADERARSSKPYIARKAIPTYQSRRSRDFAQRRRSMRFTMKEVRSALEAHSRRTGGGRIPPSPGAGSSVLDAAYVDYGTHAMRSIEGLLDTLCQVADLPADEIKRAPPPPAAQNGSDDPAKRALQSLSGIAGLIVQKAPASW